MTVVSLHWRSRTRVKLRIKSRCLSPFPRSSLIENNAILKQLRTGERTTMWFSESQPIRLELESFGIAAVNKTKLVPNSLQWVPSRSYHVN